jgi:alpha-L-glutamate ligase-like protein
MALSQSVLGLNARNYLYIRKFNRRKYKLLADDKLATKQILLDAGVPTTGLIAAFTSLDEARHFHWHSLPRSFVLKPSHGYGGRGITIVGKWDGERGRSSRRDFTIADLESEIFGILDGAHSLDNLPDEAFIEERVRIHTMFKKYTHGGVPDIRVIVCNGIPVMAMLRLPTKQSDGKANLHLGALGVGIDMRTGITTHAVANNDIIRQVPGTKLKVHGIKLPQWEAILRVAVEAQRASRLGFAGIDIVLDEEKGPLVLEVNARPGLSIQVANQASLRTRLERVSNLPVPTTERAIRLAQQLFADASLEAVDVADRTLGVIERITIMGPNKKKTIRAKIDTGAFRTSIDVDLVHELGLDEHDKLVHVRSGSGRQKRKTAKISFKMKGKTISTIASYTERSHLRFPIIIGRRDLKGFLVDPERIPEGVTVR